MKKVLISGTSSGLGENLAYTLLNNGWKVFGLSRTSNTKLLQNENFTQILVDISNKENLIESLKIIDKIDCLINNAAIFKMMNFENTSFEDIESIINTNVLGTMFLTKASLNLLSENGKIIFINSVAGLNEFENQSIYCASKHALTAFSSILSKEIKHKKIKTISIHPGGINTQLWSNSPYPLGDVNKALNTQDISNLILFIINSPDYIDYKTVTLFPEIENH